MTHGEGLNPPEPPKDWTDTHELNETLRGEVIERDNFESKSDGTPFSVLIILTKDGDRRRVPCSRTDLRPIIEQDGADVGDELAVTYWGKAGPKFVYTHEIRKADWSAQGQLT